MEPVFDAARKNPKRLIYAEGEEERVLRAVQVVVDEGLAKTDPDRPAEVIATRIEALRPAAESRASTVEIVNPHDTGATRTPGAVTTRSPSAREVTRALAQTQVRTRTTLIARCWCRWARPMRCCAAPSAPTPIT